MLKNFAKTTATILLLCSLSACEYDYKTVNEDDLYKTNASYDISAVDYNRFMSEQPFRQKLLEHNWRPVCVKNNTLILERNR